MGYSPAPSQSTSKHPHGIKKTPPDTTVCPLHPAYAAHVDAYVNWHGRILRAEPVNGYRTAGPMSQVIDRPLSDFIRPADTILRLIRVVTLQQKPATALYCALLDGQWRRRIGRITPLDRTMDRSCPVAVVHHFRPLSFC